MRKHKRHGSYKFTEKTHSKRGIVATILALVLLVLYLVILELAFRANGGLSAYYGSIGVLAMLASVRLPFIKRKCSGCGIIFICSRNVWV